MLGKVKHQDGPPAELPTAPEMNPHVVEFCLQAETDSGTRSGNDCHWQAQYPGSYDGRMPWDAYHTHFKMLARLNRWMEDEKATYLAVSLKGSALIMLSNLTQKICTATLPWSLLWRPDSAWHIKLNYIEVHFKARTCRRDEDLPEMAKDIERLSRLTYPDTTQSMLDILAKDQFIDALHDEDTRLRIHKVSRKPYVTPCEQH